MSVHVQYVKPHFTSTERFARPTQKLSSQHYKLSQTNFIWISQQSTRTTSTECPLIHPFNKLYIVMYVCIVCMYIAYNVHFMFTVCTYICMYVDVYVCM